MSLQPKTFGVFDGEVHPVGQLFFGGVLGQQQHVEARVRGGQPAAVHINTVKSQKSDWQYERIVQAKRPASSKMRPALRTAIEFCDSNRSNHASVRATKPGTTESLPQQWNMQRSTSSGQEKRRLRPRAWKEQDIRAPSVTKVSCSYLSVSGPIRWTTKRSSESPPMGARLDPVVKKSSFFFSSSDMAFTCRKRKSAKDYWQEGPGFAAWYG